MTVQRRYRAAPMIRQVFEDTFGQVGLAHKKTAVQAVFYGESHQLILSSALQPR